MPDDVQTRAEASKTPKPNSGERARHDEKKRKQSESFNLVCGDPVAIVAATPCDPVLREHYSEVAEKDDKVKESVGKISSDSAKSLGPWSEERVRRADRYIDKRRKVAREIDMATRRKIECTEKLKRKGLIDHEAAERILSSLKDRG